MKVLALIYADENAWEALPQGEREQTYASYREFMTAAGDRLADGSETASSKAATTVRVRDGDAQVTDGPFAETKEQLGGFVVLDVSLDGRGGRVGRADPRRLDGRRRAARGPRGGLGMRYLLLLNNDAADVEEWRKLTPDEARKARQQEIPRWNELFQWLGERGIEVDGLELEEPDKALVVRVRDGQTIVSDGPYAETKEIVGGYFVVKAEDLDQAIEVAQRVPVASKGSVEIRPLNERTT